ncbi:hypothetical protein O181_079834 [Austropuccinia psidii MF-1]|uniref:Palmitoyltransferase n=1 Tax=Austropuccinia psidii MF-1 TaxID=1389203 RepID=A0A9Q3FJ94_9BASI|nr:hypothetical protein [Austropuccinia psidii MF-1]
MKKDFLRIFRIKKFLIFEKVLIFIGFSIFFYSYFVLFRIIIIPSLVSHSSKRFLSKSEAIVVTCILNVISIFLLWSYLKILSTCAGFVVDFVPKTNPILQPISPTPSSHSTLLTGLPYSNQVEPLNPQSLSLQDDLAFNDSIVPNASNHPRDQLQINSHRNHLQSQTNNPSSSKPTDLLDHQTIPTDVSTPSLNKQHHQLSSNFPTNHQNVSNQISIKEKESHSYSICLLNFPNKSNQTHSNQIEIERISKMLTRSLPNLRISQVENRFCKKCQIIKPHRSHHCRHCDTCVLKMDHHCPWIGGCVGARNYKFFINFLQWSSVYSLFLLLIIIIVNTRENPNRPTMDGQQIAILSLAGLFTIFTISLLTTHTYLIFRNLSTIEKMNINRIKKKEFHMIRELYSGMILNNEKIHNPKCYKFMGIWKTRKIVRQLDYEWGDFTKEGNIWWLGNNRENWETVMGTNVFGWILPIKSKSDQNEEGLKFEMNKRFSQDGERRKRFEWPVELQ